MAKNKENKTSKKKFGWILAGAFAVAALAICVVGFYISPVILIRDGLTTLALLGVSIPVVTGIANSRFGLFIKDKVAGLLSRSRNIKRPRQQTVDLDKDKVKTVAQLPEVEDKQHRFNNASPEAVNAVIQLGKAMNNKGKRGK